ncbi:MAG TPA: ParB/RepB/Spo0J family partition protein [Sphingobium sp.]|nr:ParB/RepB/Spo0J family partition protein [Sphingobium sp.]
MARKQSDYLAALLADEADSAPPAPPLPQIAAEPEEPTPSPALARADRARGTTLLGRESALARLASGEVRQVTQLLLDPAKVGVWRGNARHYADLSSDNCRELIDSIIAEGGQKVPAVVRRVEGDADHDYEVIAGTRRHFSISWLRAHSYPDMMFVAQVAQLDDEAAFRLADLENRARKDVTDLERARNYAEALTTHYGSHLTRMAERLKLSKGWLSKMIKVSGIPDAIIAAFASPADVQLKPAYALAQALDNAAALPAIEAEAARLASTQQERRAMDAPGIPAAEVLKRLLDAPQAAQSTPRAEPFIWTTAHGRPALTVQSVNRQGITIRLHAGSGADLDTLASALRDTLAHLERQGLGLQR